jgi:hypothetical protein
MYTVCIKIVYASFSTYVYIAILMWLKVLIDLNTDVHIAILIYIAVQKQYYTNIYSNIL